MSKNPDWIHKEYPKTVPPTDFWTQIKRTVNGKPVSEEQIQMIVKTIGKELLLSSNDMLLDLGCGNGALAHYLFKDIKSYVGVDFSEYLIEIAQKNFEIRPDFVFINDDALHYVETATSIDRFTKCLIYGMFSYLPKPGLVLQNIARRFPLIKTVLIGNIPDRLLAGKFYGSVAPYTSLLDDRNSHIGIWYSKEQLSLLAEMAGWKVRIHNMPTDFYGSHYRYDAILYR